MAQPYGGGAYNANVYDGVPAPVLNAAFSQSCVFTGQDRSTYITPDSVEYFLSPPTFLVSEEGFGMPPIEYVTQRGPFQHGQSVKDFFLQPRTIQVVIRKNGINRADFWNIRHALLDIMRPGRGGGHAPGIYRKYLANGGIRELEVYASEGPGFPAHDPNSWDQWSVQDTIRFTAYDPVARDPRVQSIAFVSSGVVGAFPITFPWQIASFGSGAQSINYDGTWLTYPTVVMNGPLTGPVLSNLTTQEKLQLNYTIPSGRTATIDLAYGRKTATLDDGTNLIGYVSTDSDVASFHLEPGVNTFQVIATGTSAASSIVVQYFKRFIGF